MRLLAVPQWSFGRNKLLLRAFREALEELPVTAHYCESDVDRNRTATAFSGTDSQVAEALLRLCEQAFPAIDLNRHTGTYPRTGALDVCPIIPLDSKDVGQTAKDLQGFVEALAGQIADAWELPVYLYEKSDRGRSESELPALWQGGFGGLFDHPLNPDFGPNAMHSQLGIAIMGIRDFLVEFNVDLKPENLPAVEGIATEIRELRREGDARMLGVRAIGLPAPSMGEVQLSITATLPNLTPIDPIIEYVIERSRLLDMAVTTAGLVGAIRPRDMEGATRFAVRREQIIGEAEP